MKNLRRGVFGVVTALVVISPFFMPDEWVYIEKGVSVFNETWKVLGTISIYILVLFAGYGINCFYKDIFKD